MAVTEDALLASLIKAGVLALGASLCASAL